MLTFLLSKCVPISKCVLKDLQNNVQQKTFYDPLNWADNVIVTSSLKVHVPIQNIIATS